jgi:hypothetical protein
MRDGEDKNASCSAFIRAQRRDDGTRTVLLPFLSAAQMLGVPKVTVADDKAGNRLGQRHVGLFEFTVQMRELVGHFRLPHGVHPFLGQIGGQSRLPVAAF